MKRIILILALILILGTVFISGCTTTQNNTSGNTSGQNKSSGIPGYIVGPIINVGSENTVSETEFERSSNV